MKKTTILIADDHPIIRKTIKDLFRKNTDITFYGEANNGFEVIELTQKMIPDVAIIDLEMPGKNGYDTIFELHTTYPDIKTIAFSGFLNTANQQRAIDMGATATLSKTESTDVLFKAIQTVIDGKPYHSDTFSNPDENALLAEKHKLLTLREKQILNLIAEGKTSKQIASTYNISQWTVNKHRSNLKTKLGINNLAELIRYALET